MLSMNGRLYAEITRYDNVKNVQILKKYVNNFFYWNESQVVELGSYVLQK